MKCQLCGGPHEFDTSIPSQLWNKIIRKNKFPDTLCASCIIKIFTIYKQSFIATLWSDSLNGIPIEVKVKGKDAEILKESQEHLLNQIGDLNNNIHKCIQIIIRLAHPACTIDGVVDRKSWFKDQKQAINFLETMKKMGYN